MPPTGIALSFLITLAPYLKLVASFSLCGADYILGAHANLPPNPDTTGPEMITIAEEKEQFVLNEPYAMNASSQANGSLFERKEETDAKIQLNTTHAADDAMQTAALTNTSAVSAEDNQVKTNQVNVTFLSMEDELLNAAKVYEEAALHSLLLDPVIKLYNHFRAENSHGKSAPVLFECT